MAKDSLAALLEEARTKQSKSELCSVTQTLKLLSPTDRGAFEEALADPTIYGTSISKVLKTKGFDVGAPAIQRHRRGACACR